MLNQGLPLLSIRPLTLWELLIFWQIQHSPFVDSKSQLPIGPCPLYCQASDLSLCGRPNTLPRHTITQLRDSEDIPLHKNNEIVLFQYLWKRLKQKAAGRQADTETHLGWSMGSRVAGPDHAPVHGLKCLSAHQSPVSAFITFPKS